MAGVLETDFYVSRGIFWKKILLKKVGTHQVFRTLRKNSPTGVLKTDSHVCKRTFQAKVLEFEQKILTGVQNVHRHF